MSKLKGVNELFHYLKKHKIFLIFILLFSIVISIISLLPTQIVGLLVDNITGSNVTGSKKILQSIVGTTPNTIILSFGIFYLIQNIFSQFYGYSVTRFTYKIIEEVRCDIFNWLMLRKNGTLEHNDTGDVITRCTSDIEQIVRVIAGPLNGFLTNILKMALSILVLAIWNFKIALFSIVLIPIIYKLSIWISKINKKIAIEERKTIGGLGNQLSDILRNMPIVKSFNTESSETILLKETSKSIFNYRKTNLNYFNIYWLTIAFLNTLGFLSTFIFIKSEIDIGQCTAGDIVVAYTYLTNMYSAMVSISRYATDIFNADAALSRLFELREGRDDVNNNDKSSEKAEALTNSNYVEFHNVTISNGKRVFLRNISFNVKQGELLSITGRSGIGKSMIVSTLAGFNEIGEGSVEINHSTFYKKVPNMPKTMRFCFQQPYLLQRTLRDNIMYGTTKEYHKLFKDALESLSVNNILKEKGENYVLDSLNSSLSGGEQRRIAFCRTLNKKVPIYIFDEPTVELDTKNKAEILRLFSLLKRDGVVIVVTHDEDVIQISDKIYELER